LTLVSCGCVCVRVY